MAPNVGFPVTKGITREEIQAKDEQDGVHRFKYYESDRVIGRLYRAVDEDVFFEELEDDASSLFSYDSSSNILEEIWSRVEEAMDSTAWKHHLKTAEEIRDQ